MTEEMDDDLKTLHSMGYAQELSRRMGLFQNFAISFSTICILGGGITALPLALSAAGGASIGFGWPLASLFALIVAFSLAQIASAYPTAGGIYHWSSILGNRGLGWAAAWFNLLGILFGAASVNFGVYMLFKDLFVANVLKIDVSQWGWVTQTSFIAGVTIIQAIINHVGIRLTTILTDISGYLIMVGAAVLTVVLLYYAPSIDFSRLFRFENFTGAAGGNVWPASGSSIAVVFMLGLLQGIYTITGYDASGHTAEETKNAKHEVPKAMIHAVLWSGLCGYVVVCSILLALPSVAEGAAQGWNVFPWLMSQSPMPVIIKDVLITAIVIANFLCALAVITASSRMLFAFARDGGVPVFSKYLRKVCKSHRTPSHAIWVSAILTIAATLYGDAFAVLSTACAVLVYISYVLPIAAGFFSEGRTWTEKGPFTLGIFSKPIAFLATISCLVLIWVGIQPPNEKVAYLLAAMIIVMLVVWFAAERKRFPGPPVSREQVEARQHEIEVEEAEIADAE